MLLLSLVKRRQEEESCFNTHTVLKVLKLDVDGMLCGNWDPAGVAGTLFNGFYEVGALG